MRHARPATRRLITAAALAGLLAACGGTASDGDASTVPTEPPVASPSGVPTDLCELLRPEDFAAAGVDGAGEPEATTDGTGSSYCVYAGESGATGGIELDVFPNADEASAKETFATATAEGPAGKPASTGSFSESSFAIDGEVAYLTVRQGLLVLALAAPNDMNTETGLVMLAQLAIERAGSDLTGG
jgi:hypothetical protein